MFRKFTFFFFIFHFSVYQSFSQDCNQLLEDVTNSVRIIQQHLDNPINSSVQPDYIESYIIYPVISRYYNKSKNKDTAFVRRFEDFARTVWCFSGTCFNNNKSFYLSKKEIIDKINTNDISNSYQRETICMLCDKYFLDTVAVKKILEYSDTVNSEMNINANNYALMHKSLQLINLKANKCINQNIFDRYKFPLIDTIYKKFVNPFITAKDENKVMTSNEYDLFVEAMLMIAILDDKVNISENLYEYLTNNELKDKSVGNLKNNGHTVIISLWALLDLQKKLTNITKKQ